MFDLTKMLGLYTDERYDRLKKAISLLDVSNGHYMVPTRIRRVHKKNGGRRQVGFTPECEGIEDHLTVFLFTWANEDIALKELEALEESLVSVDSLSGDGFVTLLAHDKARTDVYLDACRPHSAMRALLMREGYGELGACLLLGSLDPKNVSVLIFFLFGLEFGPLTSRRVLADAIGRLPVSDFGLKDVRQAETFIAMVKDRLKAKNLRPSDLGPLEAFLETHGSRRPPKSPSLPFLRAFFRDGRRS